MENLKNAFIQALNLENMSQREFARSRDIKHANLNKFLTGAKSLSPEIKAAIFTGWTDHETGQMLFDAHIQDEMKAARIPYKLPSEIELATAIVISALAAIITWPVR